MNTIDKLRPCLLHTMNDSNCLVSISVSVGNGGATATIAAGAPTACDNTDNTASVGSYDTVAAVAVSIAIGQTGIAVYIHNSIADITHRRQDLESDLVECIWLELKPSTNAPNTFVFFIQKPFCFL